MSEQQQAQRKQATPKSFTVEFGDDGNRTIMIATLRERVRGSWSLAKLHARPQGGRDVGRVMTAMPNIPGLRMRVHMSGKVEIFDPLENQPDVLDQINRVRRQATAIYDGRPAQAVPRREMTLDRNRLTTLVLELKRKAESGSCHLVDGTEFPPDDALSGKRLFDPMNSGRKPMYHEEFEGWAERIDRNST